MSASSTDTKTPVYRNGDFVNACLRGEASIDDVDDWVDRWHELPGEEISLDDFLGFTEEEGDVFAAAPDLLRFVLTARREGKTVKEVLTT